MHRLLGMPDRLFLISFQGSEPQESALNIDAKFPKPGHYEVRVCNQCGTCASVCPVEAISEGGVYIIDADKCTGCGRCVKACPTQVMFLHEDSRCP